jgi:polar amino acid transport system permease protein
MSETLRLLQFGAGGWSDELAHGLAVTIMLAVAALPLGLGGGLFLAFASHSRHRWLSEAAVNAAGAFRGVPELLTLFLVYLGGQRFLGLAFGLAGVARAAEFSGFLAGVITLGLVFAAYASEIFLGILRTLDRSALEAARSLGIGRWPTFWFITLPELFRLGLPGLSNLWLSTIKQSALVSVIGCEELLRESYFAASSTGHQILFFAIVCLLYGALTTLSEGALALIQRRLNRGFRNG